VGRSGRPAIPVNREQIVFLYEAGLSCQVIGPLLGISWATVLRRLKRWGLAIRSIYPAWNKGLTASTDKRVRANSERTSRFTGRKHTAESKQKMSQSHKGKNIWSRGSKASEETRKRIGEASKRHWQNAEYRDKVIQGVIRGNHQRPTKPERRIIGIIARYNLPFKYTGNGSFIIHGVNPDFVNCNGAKVVLEIFGDHWHNPEGREIVWRRTELGRIMLFNSFGFKCIIFWESELKLLSDNMIVERIKSETRRLSRLHV
jgi:hypothetical protein